MNTKATLAFLEDIIASCEEQRMRFIKRNKTGGGIHVCEVKTLSAIASIDM